MRSSGVSARTSSPARLASDSEVSHQALEPHRPAAAAGTAPATTHASVARASSGVRRMPVFYPLTRAGEPGTGGGGAAPTVTVAALLPRSDRPVRSSLAPSRTT